MAAAKQSVHEAGEPNAVRDFLMPELCVASTVETLIFLRCRQMRRQAATRMSPSWNG
jgi:hypothetical protein